MLKTLELKRTEKGKALSLGNGNRAAQSLGNLADSVYRVQAVQARALIEIERQLSNSRSWLHEGLCDCAQCLYELRRQRELLEARQRVLSELQALTDDMDADEIECARCCQPFTPTMGDERLCDACALAEGEGLRSR